MSEVTPAGVAIELFHQDGRSAGVWYCSQCRIVHPTKDSATSCHGFNACECGNQIDQHYYKTCKTCRDNEQHKKEAKRLADAELIEGYADWVFVDGLGTNEGFFESPEALVEWCLENTDDDEPIIVPEFAFCCTERLPRRIDAGDVLEDMFSDSFEDAAESVSAESEAKLAAALDIFWEENKHIVAFQPDYKRKVAILAAQAPAAPTAGGAR